MNSAASQFPSEMEQTKQKEEQRAQHLLGERHQVRDVKRERERKERFGFIFPHSGFQGNDGAVMVLSLKSPNETRGPANSMMFISLHFSSFLFFLSMCDIKIIYRICIQFLGQHTVFFPFSHLQLPYFLHIQQCPLAERGICGLLTSGGDIF